MATCNNGGQWRHVVGVMQWRHTAAATDVDHCFDGEVR